MIQSCADFLCVTQEKKSGQSESGVEEKYKYRGARLDFFHHQYTMVVTKFLAVSSFRTAARCWVPVAKQPVPRYFSSRQRLVNFSNANEHESASLVSNDDVFAVEDIKQNIETAFEPTVFSSEEVFTAGPVNKA